ncbi:chromate transporter [Mycoplasmopsis pulmonis]|uniref:chromate transporter n=1 Tax=Mycoplasmopsis pulmonis TaxID=2107 RepID=UPI001004E258|nr:chromate transporter [Mycoplasmopsis pulmonis]VEU68494.1 chromate transporter [Mycoplasmopsis pulmonis]
MQKDKKPSFFSVLLFILKATFIGFGGGNALMPIIKKIAVDQRKWISQEDFDNAVIVTNMIPGPSVVEMLSFVAIKTIGKTKGMIVTLLGILPHVLMAFGLFFALNSLPEKYVYVFHISVLSVILALLILFGWRYLKMSQKELSFPIWFGLFSFTLAFSFFVPTPYNIASLIMVAVIVFVFIFELIKSKIKDKRKKDEEINN